MSSENTSPSNEGESRHTFLNAERDKWLSLKEVALVLNCSVARVRRLLPQLPHIKDGKLIRIHLDDLRPPRQEVSRERDTPTTTPVSASTGEAVVLAARRRFRALHGR